MHKNRIIFFFSILFFSSIVTPLVVLMLNDTTYDISLMEKFGEEEENKEEVKEIEKTLFCFSYANSLTFIIKKTNALTYYFKAYNSLPKKLFLPPPEQYI